ncbi:aminotransferase class I/II-fold pyridoxal phosphate-dependent enzyme [Alkalihalobacillus sp. AL-G]|uniref:aminotransferase class I/II-fold pyridoxal phosphate-dependent enzyme n=1 Tax=Alkalihalobacillus sp. AL-G TaxID=2926399 RepID=UPI00272A24C2|nr:aminotransferase class I/II-fold pyridoxal phosphate-dependent enzyme [Alkalihalobacillus sp. AL-G]WLD93440.1 aminotransferase class I/II-fold pyridoxal phosphate-dependent enzyme [Alkalihalobacillus sp. AL-G]
MKHVRTPLIDQLLRHRKEETYSFHVPGHKNGLLWAETEWSNTLLSIDATELTGLDDLHDPTGVIKEAQDLTAEAYGSDRSYFLVNGTTIGNLAMIMTLCKRGSKILVQRNSHKSVMNGIKLSGAHPVFITPEVDTKTGLATGIELDQVKSAFEHHRSFSAVVLTNPNYYGMTADLTEVITYIHQKGVPVMVDEAHGAHFGIGEPFPPSSLEMGADAVVHSAHKTLPAMTMASFLHVRSSRIDVGHLEENLYILQSSSPSYPLMASLDYARAYRDSLSEKDLMDILKSIQAFIQLLNEIPQIEVIGGKGRYVWLDPLKLTIKSKTTRSGYELQALFEKEGIFAELADPHHVLLVLPLAPLKDPVDIAARIKRSVNDLDVIENEVPYASFLQLLPSVTERILTVEQIRQKSNAYVSLAQSIGKICSETIIPYPPGIPILIEGERITLAQIKYCEHLIEKGARFQGSKIHEREIKVVD